MSFLEFLGVSWNVRPSRKNIAILRFCIQFLASSSVSALLHHFHSRRLHHLRLRPARIGLRCSESLEGRPTRIDTLKRHGQGSQNYLRFSAALAIILISQAYRRWPDATKMPFYLAGEIFISCAHKESALTFRHYRAFVYSDGTIIINYSSSSDAFARFTGHIRWPDLTVPAQGE